MLFVRNLWYVCACVYESSEASAYSFGLATNPNPTRARSYPLNINPKPDSISGPTGSGRVADLYTELTTDYSEHTQLITLITQLLKPWTSSLSLPSIVWAFSILQMFATYQAVPYFVIVSVQSF